MAVNDLTGEFGLPEGVSPDHVVEASGSDSLILPEGMPLSDCEMVQVGDNLTLTAPDGTVTVVEGYFGTENPPQLVSPGGGQMEGDMVSQLAGPLAPGQVADAGPAVGAQPIGTVESSSGTVMATRADGTQVELQAGDPVFQGDILETSGDGSIGVVLADEATFSMAENGRMVLDEMVYDPGTQEGSINLEIVQGVFTFVSGQVAKTDPDAMTLTTPVATIGIRGTQVGIEIPDGEEMRVVLMEEGDGFVGEVVVMNESGIQVMNSSAEFTTITGAGVAPSSVGTMSISEMVQSFSSALQALPQTEGNNANDYGMKEELGDAGEDEEEAEEELADVEEEAEEAVEEVVEEVVEEEVIEEEVIEEEVVEEVVEEEIVEEIEEVVEEVAEEEVVETEELADVGDVDDIGDLGDFETAAGDEGGDDTDELADVDGFSDGGDEGGDEGGDDDAALDDIEDLADFETAAGDEGDAGFGDSVVSVTSNPFAAAGPTGGDDQGGGGGSGGGDDDDDDGGVEASGGGGDTGGGDDGPAPVVNIFPIATGGAVDGTDEDTSFSGRLSATDPDGSSLSFSGSGATEHGTVEIDANGLYTYTPNADYNGSDSFTYTVTDSDGASSTATITFEVASVDDVPVVTVPDAVSGGTGTEIDLDISAAMDDVTSETVASIEISGVPTGATLSVGTDNLDGTWTISGAEELAALDGLTITSATDDNSDFTLSVTSTSTDGGTSDPVNIEVNVNVAPEAAGGTEDALEDTAFTGQLSATDVDGDTLEFTLAEGGDAAHGTVTVNADGSYSYTPDADYNGTDTFTYEVDDGQGGTDTATVTLNVASVDDVPVVTVDDSAGDEDAAIALDISAVMDGTTTETVDFVTISDVPSGAVISVGTDSGDGTIVFTPVTANADGNFEIPAGSLDHVTITPPGDSYDDFQLSVTATSTDQSTSTPSTIDVSVAPVADAPVGTVEAAFGPEDTSISLTIDVDVPGAESVAAVGINIPQGATLSVGSDSTMTVTGNIVTGSGEDGGFTESELAELANGGLSMTPPADFNGELNLTVTSMSTDGGASEAPLTVTVTPVADIPVGSVVVEPGVEDTPIALTITADVPGNEDVASITVSGVPEGASLSAGTSSEDGSIWTLTPEELAGLEVNPAPDFNGSFDLTVRVESTDGGASTGTIPVSVAAVGDAAEVSLDAAATGAEDAAIALNISAAVADSTETVDFVTISGVPDGASLSAGTSNADGTWTLEANQLDNLTITPPADSGADFSLSVTATSTDGTTGATATVPVSVAAVADAPDLDVSNVSGVEDTAIALDITAGLTDTDGSEQITSVEITGVPDGAVLSAGTDNGGGSWTLSAGDLSGLTITPDDDDADDFSLSVAVTSTDTDPDTGAETTATTNGSFNVSVGEDADAPTLIVDDAVGAEDTAIALDISASLNDPQEVLSLTIDGIPDGAVITVVNPGENPVDLAVTDGSVTIPPGLLGGAISITPPADFNGDIPLTVTAQSKHGGDSESVTEDLTVSVTAVDDIPTVSVADAAGDEDAAISLNITASMDAATTETLDFVTVSNVPDGATLSVGTDSLSANPDGSFTVTAGDLGGLNITPPAGDHADFTLSVAATSTDGGTSAPVDLDVAVASTNVGPDAADGTEAAVEDTAFSGQLSATDADAGDTLTFSLADGGGAANGTVTVNADGSYSYTPDADFNGTDTFTYEVDDGEGGTDTATITLNVESVGDAAEVSVADASGSEDTAITLDISAAVADSTETVDFVTISGVPAGASLSAGTSNLDGTWTLEAGDLSGLTVTPADDSSADFTLSVTATSTDGTTGTAADIDVSVAAVGDAAEVSVTDASGAEDTAITLDISAAVADSTETVDFVTVSGVPDGASLSAGTSNPDGSWTLEASDLSGLTITPAADDNADFTLSVTATSTDGTTGVAADIDVSVAAVGDAAEVSVSDASGSEDAPISLDISAAVADSTETVDFVTVSGVPDGASLSAGTSTIPGTWTLEASELDGLTITPPADSGADFNLTVAATSTDGTTGAPASIPVSVAAVADAPDLDVSNVSGVEDTAIALDITAGLTDTDGSEQITSVEITGVPDGAVLSAGTDNGGGSWTLEAGDLSGLTVTPVLNDDTDFSLSVAVTSTDTDPDTGAETTATTNGSFNVSVGEDADAPTLIVDDAVGAEDTAIALDISASLNDPQEVLSLTIDGIPDGAVITVVNPGENPVDLAVTDGSVTIPPGLLGGEISITPPEDFNGDIPLTVTAQSKHGDDSESVTEDLTVSVTPVADTTVSGSGTGAEDSPIDLAISPAVAGGEEVASVTITGVPDGASLSVGTDNGGGSWTLTPAQLNGLQLDPPADFNGDISLNVSATMTDGSTSTASPFTVSVTPVEDAPTGTVGPASGAEDSDIALVIDIDVPGAESVAAISVGNLPEGATLSVGSDSALTVFDNTVVGSGADGSFTVADLAELAGGGLVMTPPADFNGELNLSVNSMSTDGGTSDMPLAVTVTPVADAPEMTVSEASGLEDTAIPLNISADVPGNEDLAEIAIGNVPAGATLSVGTDSGLNLDGNVLSGSGEGGVFTVDDLLALEGGALSITPAADDNSDFNLNVTATSTDGGSSAAVLPISVAAVAEDADVTFSVSDGEGETTLPGADDYGEAETIQVDGGGVEYTYDDADSATVSVTDEWGSVNSIDATSDDAADVVLQDFVEANVTLGGEGDSTVDIENAASGDVATGSGDDSIEITGQAGESGAFDVDAGAGDDTITVDGDYDASAVVGGAGQDTITTGGGEDVITGGADNDVIDGGAGVDVAVFSGSFTDYAISIDDTTGEITVAGPDGTDTLVNIETLRFDDGDVPVDSLGTAEPIISITPAAGNEDSAVALVIDASAGAASDPIGSITIGGVPAGATLSVGTSDMTLDGNVLSGSGVDGQFTASDLQALSDGAVTITPPENSDVDFSLSVSATSAGGASAQSVSMPVTVDAVADVPVITVELGDPTVTGGDGGGTPLHYWNFEEKRDGDFFDDQVGGAHGEEYSIVEVDGEGRFGNAGDFDSDRWRADDAISVPHTEDMELGSGTVTVWFNATNVDRTQGILSKDSWGYDDGGHLTMGVVDGEVKVRLQSDNDSFTVDGGTLSDNTWHQATFSWGDGGMKLYVDGALVDSDDYTGGIATNQNPLIIGANSAWSGDDSATHGQLGQFFKGHIDDAAMYGKELSAEEVATLYSDGVQAMMDGDGADTIEYPLVIATNLTDADGSESLGDVTISGIPEGATLSAGADNEDGTWTVSQGDLADLKVTVGNDVAADFQVSVSVTSTEAVGGDTAVASASVTVPVDGNDAPVLEGDGETTVAAGGDVTISAADMHLTDDTSGADELLYTLTDDVDFGSLYLDDGSGNRTDLDVGDSFSQEDIDLGLLSYEQDESLADFWDPATPEWSDGGAPIDQGNLTMPLAAESVTVTFEGESAGYDNSLGWYKLDADGNPTDPQMIWTNTDDDELSEGTSVTLDGLAPGEQFGFFIVKDGADEYPWLDGQNTSDNTMQFGDNGNIEFVNNGGNVTQTIESADLFYTDQSLNSDNVNHALSGTEGDGLMIGFEDLTGGGDNDFNDVTFSVKYDNEVSSSPTSDSFTFTAEDGDGAKVADSDEAGDGYTVTDGAGTFDITIDNA